MKHAESDLIDEHESRTIRGVQVVIQGRYYRCRICGGDWDHRWISQSGELMYPWKKEGSRAAEASGGEV
jgi:hypothetical protein